MAHQIDFQKGTAGFVSYKQPAWHGLGKVIETELSVEEAIKFANLDFLVEKAPNIHRIPGQEDVISTNSFFTYRTDTNFVLGDKLGTQYHVVQNEEALSVVEGLIKEGKVIVETAGSLRNGATVFMCCKLPEPIVIKGSDEIRQYVVIAAGHDGQTAIMAYFTNVRVVCANTLQTSLRDARQKYSIRHTPSAKDKLNEALKIMVIARKNQEKVGEAYEQMTRVKLAQNDFWNYVGNVFLSDAEIKELQNGKNAREVISTRKQNQINKVLEFAETGIGQREAEAGSGWWAYNAVTGYFSNVVNFDTPEARMEGLLFNGAGAKMETALQLALNPEQIKPLKRASVNFNLN